MSKQSFAEEVWESMNKESKCETIANVACLQKENDPKIVEKTIKIFWTLLCKKWPIQWRFEEFMTEFQEVQGISEILITRQHEWDSAHEKLVNTRRELHESNGEKKKLVWPFLRLAKDVRKKFVYNFILAVLETCATTNAQLVAKREEPETIDAPGLTTADLAQIEF